MDLYEASFEEQWLEWAVKLQEKQDELFWDAKEFGYFTDDANDASVLLRLKEGEISQSSLSLPYLMGHVASMHRCLPPSSESRSVC